MTSTNMTSTKFIVHATSHITLFFSVPDVVNLNLKSTLRVLYNLFTNYKNSEWRPPLSTGGRWQEAAWCLHQMELRWIFMLWPGLLDFCPHSNTHVTHTLTHTSHTDAWYFCVVLTSWLWEPIYYSSFGWEIICSVHLSDMCWTESYGGWRGTTATWLPDHMDIYLLLMLLCIWAPCLGCLGECTACPEYFFDLNTQLLCTEESQPLSLLWMFVCVCVCVFFYLWFTHFALQRTSAMTLHCQCSNQKLQIAMLPFPQDVSVDWLVGMIIDCVEWTGRISPHCS